MIIIKKFTLFKLDKYNLIIEKSELNQRLSISKSHAAGRFSLHLSIHPPFALKLEND